MDGPGLRERKRADARARVLDAALELYAARGYGAVTVADVCAAADIGQRTFFRYFPTKEDTLLAPLREMGDRLREALLAAPAALGPAAAVDHAVLALGTEIAGDGGLTVRLLHVVGQESAAGARELTAVSDRERDLVATLAARAPAGTPAWRLRLAAARATTALRVWLRDLVDDAEEVRPDPVAHLREVLAAT